MTFQPPLSVRAAIQAAAHALTNVSPTPALDAEILVRHASGLTREGLVVDAERPLSATECDTLAALIARRQRHEPIAYLTGRREFWSLDLTVSPETLIPRPETECLVERALTRIPLDTVCSVVDLGTGSGAVALAIAQERPRTTVTATDLSSAALEVATGNAARLGISNVEFQEGDWFAPLAGRRFQFVISNPPYIKENDPHLAKGDVRFEPRRALVGGADGFAAIRRIAASAPEYLTPDGWLMFEHSFDQGADVRNLLLQQGYRNVSTHRDLSGNERVTEAQWLPGKSG